MLSQRVCNHYHENYACDREYQLHPAFRIPVFPPVFLLSYHPPHIVPRVVRLLRKCHYVIHNRNAAFLLAWALSNTAQCRGGSTFRDCSFDQTLPPTCAHLHRHILRMTLFCGRKGTTFGSDRSGRDR